MTYASTSNIRKVIKFYNLFDQSFEIDCGCIVLAVFQTTYRLNLSFFMEET